jgi:hypothetical protein
MIMSQWLQVRLCTTSVRVFMFSSLHIILCFFSFHEDHDHGPQHSAEPAWLQKRFCLPTFHFFFSRFSSFFFLLFCYLLLWFGTVSRTKVAAGTYFPFIFFLGFFLFLFFSMLFKSLPVCFGTLKQTQVVAGTCFSPLYFLGFFFFFKF